MKKLLIIVFSVLFSQALAVGAMASSLFSQGPTPDQQYQSATGSNSAQTKAESEAAAIAKVKAIMAQSKRLQETNTGSKVTKINNFQGKLHPTPEGTPPATSQSTVTGQTANDLAQQINDLGQNANLFQQQADQRLEALSTKNSQLQQEINKLDQAMTLLNQEMNTLNSKLQTGQTISQVNPLGNNQQSFLQSMTSQSAMRYWVIVLAVIVVLLLAMMTIPRNKRSKVPVDGAADDTKDEYDFMGSDEGIPAKLDLARAYLAMGDNDSARNVLAQVMLKGDESQKQSAVDLLKQIH